MRVIDVQIELLQRHWQQVHHIPNVQVENPVVLVLNAQDGLDVVFKLGGLYEIAVGALIE